MKGPVQYSHGRVRYTGRLRQDRFRAWTESLEGQPAVAQVASRIRFALFGRERSARRQLWKQLTTAARDHGVAGAIQHEIDQCLGWLDTLAHAQDLPRVTIDMYRLVAVPRLFMNAVTYRHMDAALRRQPAFMAIEGGDSPRGWFVLTIIDAIESAFAAARPSPTRPLPAGERWLTVGVNQQFEWRAPVQGPAWPGHYYVLERSPAAMKRAFRKSANEAISKLDASLPSLSVAHRTGILKQAGASLERLNAHL